MKHSWSRLLWMMAALLAACASYARALTVSPARTEVRLPPGGETSAVITVTNAHPEAYDVELSEKPWFVYPENRTIQVEQWLKLPSKKHFRLKPGASRDVKVKIQCPKDATGEVMGMVSFAYHGRQPGSITPMISTAVYLKIAGTEKNTGEISALGVGAQGGRFQVAVRVKATGNVRLRPTGIVRLLNEQGHTVTAYDVREMNPIFPGVTTDLAANGPQAMPAPGHYTLSAELTSGTLIFKEERKIVVKSNGDVQVEESKP